jgi:hypothetical protein
MTQADSVHSTPPTNTPAIKRDRAVDHLLLEGSMDDVFHMANIVASKLSAADGLASLQQLEELVFSVNHLCDMVRDLRTEYYDGTEVFCGKASCRAASLFVLAE